MGLSTQLLLYVRDNAPTSTVGWSAVTPWSAGATIVAGALRRQLTTPAVNSERVFVCIIAGTTHATTEPTWVVTKGAKTVDNTVTWMECTGQPGVNGDNVVITKPTTASLSNINMNPVVFPMTDTAGIAVGMTISETAANMGLYFWNTTGTVTSVSPNVSVTVSLNGFQRTIPSGTSFSFCNTVLWWNENSSAISLGGMITNTAGTALFICTTAGVTAATPAEPTWNTAAGATTVDNTVTWTSLGPPGNFSAWSAPFARLAAAFSWGVAGTVFYVADDHSETVVGAINLTAPGTSATRNYVYSFDHTASFPLTSANLLAGAKLTTTGNFKINLTGYCYAYGLTLTLSATTGSCAWVNWILEACKVMGQGGIQPGQGNNVSGGSLTIFNNTSIGSALISLTAGTGLFQWINTPSAVVTLSSSLFATAGGSMEFDGVDFSGMGSAVALIAFTASGGTKFTFNNCKFASGATLVANPTAEGGPWIDVINCNSGAVNYYFAKYRYTGTLTPETTLIRTGGASNGTTGSSFKMVSNAGSTWVNPFDSVPIGIWNAVTGATVTCTVCGIWAGAALPNNDQVWTQIEYLGSASSPITTFASGTKSNNLAAGSALTADTSSAWDSLTTARANTTAYVLGQVIKLASNPGRIFFCTTAGTSAGSEPGDYASAVDGGSVTDNTAVFQAGFRFKMVSVLSSPPPQMVGDLYAIVRAALPSTTFYVDPVVTVT